MAYQKKDKEITVVSYRGRLAGLNRKTTWAEIEGRQFDFRNFPDFLKDWSTGKVKSVDLIKPRFGDGTQKAETAEIPNHMHGKDITNDYEYYIWCSEDGRLCMQKCCEGEHSFTFLKGKSPKWLLAVKFYF